MSNIRERRFEVDQNFVGWRVDQYLSNRIPRMSRSKAAQVARFGDVRMESGRVGKIKASTRLLEGDVLILREELEEEEVQYEEVELLYEDDALLIVSKPAGMLVHESSKARLNTVREYLVWLGEEEAEPVHRIDRETSGVLVCARRREWITPLREMFALRGEDPNHPSKVYRALVWNVGGLWEVGQYRRLDWPLGLDPESAIKIRMGLGELEAVTHAWCVGRGEIEGFGAFADVRVRIETGRQHQIRVHMAMLGTPVVADKLYSLGEEFFMAWHAAPEDEDLLSQLPFSRQALHAWRMGLRHPGTGEEIWVEAPLPGIWGGGEGG